MPLSASTLIFICELNIHDNVFSKISTTGMLEIAQPDAVVISALLVHTIAVGATPFILNE